MSWWDRYKLWLEVVETGGGWFVERDNRTVALLTDPRYVDMFWYAWRIEPLIEEEAERAALFSQAYWDPVFLPRTVFRSREYDWVATAFWAGENPVRDGRLVMRALYQRVRRPWPWDDLVLWARRRWLRR
jgi:hypothetical protein